MVKSTDAQLGLQIFLDHVIRIPIKYKVNAQTIHSLRFEWSIHKFCIDLNPCKVYSQNNLIKFSNIEIVRIVEQTL